MKKIIMTAAILGLTATGALAESQDININATVTSFCTLAAGSSNGDVSIAVTNGVPGAVTGSNTFDVLCNNSTTVTLSSANGGLNGDSGLTATSPFSKKINYTATATGVDGGSTNLSLTTDGTPAGSSNVHIGGAIAATVPVAISSPTINGGSVLLAGGYSDVLTLSVVAD